MRKIFLLQKTQNEIGLSVDFDLDTPEPLEDAKRMVESPEDGDYLCYYSASSQPLIEWLSLLNDFVVVTDNSFVTSNPFPVRLGFSSIDIREVIALKSKADRDAEEPHQEEKTTFSNLSDEEEGVVDE